MRKIISLKNINIFFLLAITASIPFLTKMLSYPIIFWVFTSIILYIKSHKKLDKPTINKGIIFLWLFYISVVASVIYSDDKADAFFDTEVKLSLLIIPLGMILLKEIYQPKRRLILSVFAFSNVIASAICIIAALYNSTTIVDGKIIFNTIVPIIYEDTNTAPPSYFAYTDFSLFKHPAYFSAYLILSFFIIIDLIKNKIYLLKSKTANRFIYIISILLILSALFFLQSKAGYLTFFVVLALFFLWWIIKKKKFILGSAIITLIIIAAMYWYNNNSRFYYIRNALLQKEDFVEAVANKEHKYILERYGIDRISLWIIASEVASENFLLGCGAGDVHTELNAKFSEYNLDSFTENRYNAHNQYIETFLTQGIIGFLLMLLWLIYPFFKNNNYKNHNYLFLIFITVLAFNFIFESMLNSISGVIYTAFFYGLFANTKANNDINICKNKK